MSRHLVGAKPAHQEGRDGEEANLGKELSESSLDSRLAALRTQAGDVQAKQQLAELKAKKAAQQAAAGQKTM